ncbi:putative GATA transcription factor 22 isoform X3 [Cornus florida]|uniref:putative GATA transcription factor 22 isoform X3 n=1 Tax=Cornus florida TaxID=4283 RepID=UPI0028990286|nr:putative GATA transcription factor 22 isoform X3 [Cornus florida]
MSDASRGLGASPEHNRVEPDYFGYYKSEVADLLSQDEDFLPFSSQNSDLAGRRACDSLTDKDQSNKQFCNSVGAGLSDFKKERLKALLQQSVFVLTQEVDEIQDPVASICRIQSNLRCKKGSGAACDGDAGQHPHKKLKLSSSSSLISAPHSNPVNCSLNEEDSGYEDMDVVLPKNETSNGVEKKCAQCHTTETSKWRTGPGGPKSLCNACGVKLKQGDDFPVMKDQKTKPGSNIGAEEENNEVDDDLQFLLENDVFKVEETMKKYSDELFTTLGHMDQKLEEILNMVTSSCSLSPIAGTQGQV